MFKIIKLHSDFRPGSEKSDKLDMPVYFNVKHITRFRHAGGDSGIKSFIWSTDDPDGTAVKETVEDILAMIDDSLVDVSIENDGKIKPAWYFSIPYCDKNCYYHDGEKCGQLNEKPSLVCQPAVRIINKDYKHISNKPVHSLFR